MRKKLLITLVVLFCALRILPLGAFARAQTPKFVSSDEATLYHYFPDCPHCGEIEGELKWYTTKEQAELDGKFMCIVCEGIEADYYDAPSVTKKSGQPEDTEQQEIKKTDSWWPYAAWFVGMCVVGGFVYNFFGMQISISKRCALKLYSMVCNDREYWYSDICRKYFKKVIRTDTIIILVISLLVLQFIPLIGTVGFFIGYFLNWLSTRGVTGITETNLEESIEIFLRFAKPGKELEFEENLHMAANKLNSDRIFRV